MSDDSLDTMLGELTKGESAAAEQLFRNYEPFLRAMVRRRLSPPLRSKFDSMDVVQSVWAEVLAGFRIRQWEFKDQAALKAFLARMTYNKFVTECRRNSQAVEHERPLSLETTGQMTSSGLPRPSEVVQADELWETLHRLCPPAHRQILELKRQGLLLSEIAARVGLHEGSVRRILYDLAWRLAAIREAPSGGDLPASESTRCTPNRASSHGKREADHRPKHSRRLLTGSGSLSGQSTVRTDGGSRRAGEADSRRGGSHRSPGTERSGGHPTESSYSTVKVAGMMPP